MKNSSHIPSLAELFSQNSTCVKVEEATNLPTLTDLLKNNSPEKDIPPLSQRFSDLRSNHYSCDKSLPLLSSSNSIPSLSELSSSPQYCGNFTSLKELNGSICSSSKVAVDEGITKLNQCSTEETISLSTLDDLHGKKASSGSGGAASLPSLLNLLSFGKDGGAKQLDKIVRETSGFHELSSFISPMEISTQDPVPPKDLLEQRNCRSVNLDVCLRTKQYDRKAKKGRHGKILRGPSSFSKVVGAQIRRTTMSVSLLSEQLDRTFCERLPAEIILTNTSDYDIDVDKIFSFSSPSPDDNVRSHQEKAFERNY